MRRVSTPVLGSSELRTLAYCERETLVNAHEPLEELLVLERGLVLCDAKVMSSGDTIGSPPAPPSLSRSLPSYACALVVSNREG